MEYWKKWREEICSEMDFEPSLPEYARVVCYTDMLGAPFSEHVYLYYDETGRGVCRLECHDTPWIRALIRGDTVPGDADTFDASPEDRHARVAEKAYFSRTEEALPPFPGFPWNFRLVFTDADYRPALEFVMKGGSVHSRDKVGCYCWLYRYGTENGNRIFVDKDGNKAIGGIMRRFEWDAPK